MERFSGLRGPTGSFTAELRMRDVGYQNQRDVGGEESWWRAVLPVLALR